MMGLVLKKRRKILDERSVRKEIGLMLDFEWEKRNIFEGKYRSKKRLWEG